MEHSGQDGVHVKQDGKRYQRDDAGRAEQGGHGAVEHRKDGGGAVKRDGAENGLQGL
ncbi:MAG: hypothetical protein HDR53_03795 [Treponema sp.]|nr:hypothetical protein [Treponema sp.]